MKRTYRVSTLLLVLLVTLNSCGFKHVKTPNNSAINYDVNQMGYKEMNSVVFNRCTQCHSQSNPSGSIVLDSYEAIKTNLSKVQDEVSGGTMPPDAPLPTNEINLVVDWIQLGAPEFPRRGQDPGASPTPATSPEPSPSPDPSASPTASVSPSPSPSETPAPSGLVATYTSIRQHVFEPKCLSCHSAGHSQKKRPLDSYEAMMAASKLVVPGNPAKSTVYIEVSGGTMPPRHQNAVTDFEVEVIKAWIQNGAPKD